MTNPNDSVGTNGAYGGRTSVNALNDVLASFSGRGVLSGWAVTVSSGMTVDVGGSAGVRDVAIAEDNAGNRTTIDNRSSSPISVTLSAASASSARVDYIVAYVNNPATVLVTTIDNPSTCGIIAVNGTTSAPTEAAVRSAITADGGTGSTAYYVVLATITIAAGTTDLTDSNIAQGAKASSGVGFATLSISSSVSVSSSATKILELQNVPAGTYYVSSMCQIRGNFANNSLGGNASIYDNGNQVLRTYNITSSGGVNRCSMNLNGIVQHAQDGAIALYANGTDGSGWFIDSNTNISILRLA